jgi:hypothetical protein
MQHGGSGAAAPSSQQVMQQGPTVVGNYGQQDSSSSSSPSDGSSAFQGMGSAVPYTYNMIPIGSSTGAAIPNYPSPDPNSINMGPEGTGSQDYTSRMMQQMYMAQMQKAQSQGSPSGMSF